MSRPKASEARDTRREILDAALELFAQDGFFGTSMRQLAREVGVRESALYHYFPNKDAILDALMNETGQEAADTLTTVFERVRDADLRTLFEQLAIQALDRFSTAKQRKLFRIMMSDGVRLASQGRFNFVERSAGIPRAAAMRLMKQLCDEGRIRASSPELLTIEFIAPMLLWRHMLVVFPSHPWVTDYKSFARAHVEHFLRAVAPEAVDTSSQKQVERSVKVSSQTR